MDKLSTYYNKIMILFAVFKGKDYDVVDGVNRLRNGFERLGKKRYLFVEV